MIENLLGKTGCYDVCPIAHGCFGGYLNENPTCDGEFKRILTALDATPGVSRPLFAPNKKGLQFLFQNGETVEKVCLAEGIIQKEEIILSIDPTRREEYAKAIEEKYHKWYDREWAMIYDSYEYFHDNIAHASFVAYLEYFLGAMDDTGRVSASKLETELRQKMDWYFREEKFQTAVHFFETDDWKSL